MKDRALQAAYAGRQWTAVRAREGENWLAIGSRVFTRLDEGRYQLQVADGFIVFEVDLLRRERHELVGELTVHCAIAGARTYNGVLLTADFNFSSANAIQTRAKLLQERSRTNLEPKEPEELDWFGLLDEFRQRVFEAERTGEPAQRLCDLQEPSADAEFEIQGWRLLRDEPVIAFGDGGALKSYFGLWAAGEIARRGLRVLYADWEFSGEQHRKRLRLLFGATSMPDGVYYKRCNQPLVHLVDQLRRYVRDQGIQYIVCDSVAYACTGAPELAEVAMEYFQCVRRIGVGSLHIAHIVKGEGGELKPFGSAFWHNSARGTWFMKRSGEADGGREVAVGLFNRKSNTGTLLPPLGFRVTFNTDATIIRRGDLANVPDLAENLSIKQRMIAAVRHGTIEEQDLAAQVGAPLETVKRYAREKTGPFTYVCDTHGNKQIGLVHSSRP